MSTSGGEGMTGARAHLRKMNVHEDGSLSLHDLEEVVINKEVIAGSGAPVNVYAKTARDRALAESSIAAGLRNVSAGARDRRALHRLELAAHLEGLLLN
jgi:hypothetical protein